MEKVWLKNYEPGVPAEINADAYQSIVEIFQESCNRYANHPAFYNLGVTFSYGDIDRYASEIAAYFQQVLHLKKGDRFAIMLPNVLQYPIVMLAALRIGLIVVNINPLYQPDELAYQLNDSGANTIIVLANFANTVEKALPRVPALKNIIVTKLGDLFPFVKRVMTNFALKYIYRKVPRWRIPNVRHFRHILAQGKSCSLQPVSLNNRDIAFLQYTGGTTGLSKGAILTHRNIIANLQQADAWFANLIMNGQEIVITALPLYHIFSLTANCLFFSKKGGLNILITNPRDIPAMVKDMKRFKFTAITGVNTLFNALLKNSQFAQLDFSHLKLALGGGMAVQRIVAEKWQALTKSPLLEAYGLTEASPCVTINPTNLQAYNGTIGLPVSSTNVAILDDDHHELPIGQAGELAVKGPQVMPAYWYNPLETEKVFTTEGWLLTGDIAAVDDKGFVRILERKKDMILVSGFNVYPNEIEDVIAKIPGVREVAVIGMRTEGSGEIVKAFIVRDNNALTESAVIKYCREHLTGYKIPKQIEFRTELPKTNVGKILRRALRQPVLVSS